MIDRSTLDSSSTQGEQQQLTVAADPKFSVIVPLYNKGEYVDRAVRSVLAQEYTDFELLVIDDGSTDDGVARLKSGFNDARIRIISQINAGVGAARNRGISEARGSLLAFLDADDEWYQHHLSNLLYLAEHFPSAGIVASQVACASAEQIDASNTVRLDQPRLISNYFALMARPGTKLINSTCAAIRREVVNRCGRFLEATPYGEDQEYWARVCLYYPLAFHPVTSAIYWRNLPGSAMSRRRWAPEEIPVVGTLNRYLALHPNSPDRRDIIDYAAWILLNHIADGISVGASKAAAVLLDNPILSESRFQRRLFVLRLAVAAPESFTRHALRIHCSPALEFWRKFYWKLLSPPEPLPSSSCTPEVKCLLSSHSK